MTNITILLLTLLSSIAFAQSGGLDVKSYKLYLEPKLTEGSIKGVVSIVFTLEKAANEVVLDAGDLQVSTVKGENVKSFRKEGKKLRIKLKTGTSANCNIEITYEGIPKYGINFNKPKGEVYTVFSTSQWMICNDDPSDRATIQMEIVVPKGKLCIASGELLSQNKNSNKTHFIFEQTYESPSYTYGLAIGDFNHIAENINQTRINSYASIHDTTALKQIFQYSGDMVRFFEEKSGVPFVQETYSQILIGSHYQEMSGLSVLKESYGKMILNDSTETNLISHELAHQWWGNMITCENWNHFWLNEAFATFMSAAYNEHRFGKGKYELDINSYKKVYEDILARGKDKPLVFSDWFKPSRDDRNIVYFKGAYVLHLLRNELGEEVFWNGIKNYSMTYWGKAVITKDFQVSMEKSTGTSLSSFFEKWIY